jgi:hypothetical protein
MKSIELGKTGLCANIDDDDYALVNQYCWTINRSHGCVYAITPSNKYGGVAILMHRLIMGLSKGDNLKIDHKDGYGLNNRKSNLRLATDSQNQHNRIVSERSRTGFKCVMIDSRRPLDPFYVEVKLNGEKFRSKHFATVEEAKTEHIRMAHLLHGEFAKTESN